MTFSLQNHLLRIEVQRKGAELVSLRHLESGREYMWQADPTVWGSHAPVLFPIIGTLRGGSMTFRGKEYRIPKHGFIRHNETLELFSRSEDRLTLRLMYSEETLEMYPFRFEFRITFRLRNQHVIVYHEIFNHDQEPIYFHLGGHPAFRVPFFEGENYEDYLLRFEHAENSRSYTVTNEGTIASSTRTVPWAAGGTELPLTHDLFTEDALVFKDLKSRSVTLESRHRGPVLKLDFAGWTHLGIWAKPQGDFVCLEPWLGLADAAEGNGDFTDKEGIVRLDANEKYEKSFDIKVL